MGRYNILPPMVCFADDDSVLIAETVHDLQRALAEMQTDINEMRINSSQTIILVSARGLAQRTRIYT